jgi:hypothetical protein
MLLKQYLNYDQLLFIKMFNIILILTLWVQGCLIGAVGVSRLEFPQATQPTLSGLETVGDYLSQSFHYVDDVTGNVTSEYWHSLSGDTKALINGSATLGSFVFPIERVVSIGSRVVNSTETVLGGVGESSNFAKYVENETNVLENLDDVLGEKTGADNVANGLRLRTQLAFQEAGILDESFQLTTNALDNSKLLINGENIGNQKIISVLTEDGFLITDWSKFTTNAVKMPNGQNLQVHFYQNTQTGKVDYLTPDFKVKGIVNP